MQAASGSASNPEARRPALVRAIGRWDLTAAAINGVLGAAVFSLPSVLAGLTGAWSPLAYVFGGLGILAVVLCLAEVASRFKEAGGPYLYAREAFGPFIGFQCGWLWFWSRVLAVAAVLNMLVDYLSQLLPEVGRPIGRTATMCAVMGFVTILNVTGVRRSARSVDFFTLVKLAPLLSLIILGLTRVRTEVFLSQGVLTSHWTQATLLTVYAYAGFEAALVPGGEVRDPRRDSAFALLVSLGVVAAVLLLVQLVVVGVVRRAADSPVPVAAALGVLVGRGGVPLASFAAILSALGWAIGATLACPRILFAMGERGELPRSFANVHARFRTPHVAIVVFSTLSLAFALFSGFVANASFSAIVRLSTYCLICGALIALRRRRPTEVPGFFLRGGYVIAFAGMLFCLGLLCTLTVTQTSIFALIVGVGTLLWVGARAERFVRTRRPGSA